MDDRDVARQQYSSCWRDLRHDLWWLSGGALLGLGLMFRPSAAVFGWILVVAGVAAAIAGAVESIRIGLADARMDASTDTPMDPPMREPQLKRATELIVAPTTHTKKD